MALSDYFQFENPSVVAFALGVLIFIICLDIFTKRVRIQRGAAVIVALVAGLSAGWYAYRNNFVQESWAFSLMLILLAIVILAKIIIPFFKSLRRKF